MHTVPIARAADWGGGRPPQGRMDRSCCGCSPKAGHGLEGVDVAQPQTVSAWHIRGRAWGALPRMHAILPLQHCRLGIQAHSRATGCIHAQPAGTGYLRHYRMHRLVPVVVWHDCHELVSCDRRCGIDLVVVVYLSPHLRRGSRRTRPCPACGSPAAARTTPSRCVCVSRVQRLVRSCVWMLHGWAARIMNNTVNTVKPRPFCPGQRPLTLHHGGQQTTHALARVHATGACYWCMLLVHATCWPLTRGCTAQPPAYRTAGRHVLKPQAALLATLGIPLVDWQHGATRCCALSMSNTPTRA